MSTRSTAERWAILQQAVQTLGLKKVADTLAGHIRRNKAKTNGEIIYAKAISKWQHDLDKLKKTYYRKNFTWPKSD
ncbi:MAG: hypothetical protein ABS951_14495 [Solibacillus sp.]